MRRVLYIGAGNIWSGGAGFLVRQKLFVRALAEVAELHLAVFDAGPEDKPPIPCQWTVLPTPQRKPRSRVGAIFGDLFSSQPRVIRGLDLLPARSAVASLHPETFDAAFAYRIDFAHYAGVLGHRKLILDIDDPEHIRQQRRVRATTGHDGDWRTARDLIKLRRFEQRAVEQAVVSFVCQANDQTGWPREPRVVPNCVEVVARPARQATEPRVLFVGNCLGRSISPNVDAVLFFLKEIWPVILWAVPGAVFQIVGTAGDVVREAAGAAPRVELCGFVDDLAQVYSRASISVAPIRFGTGTRIKILDAFAHACPVVSTTAGVEGIAATPGQQIELGDTAGDFAQRCIALLKDPAAAERVGQAGHELAARSYDAAALQPKLVRMFQDFFESSAGAVE